MLWFSFHYPVCQDMEVSHSISSPWPTQVARSLLVLLVGEVAARVVGPWELWISFWTTSQRSFPIPIIQIIPRNCSVFARPIIPRYPQYGWKLCSQNPLANLAEPPTKHIMLTWLGHSLRPCGEHVTTRFRINLHCPLPSWVEAIDHKWCHLLLLLIRQTGGVIHPGLT